MKRKKWNKFEEGFLKKSGKFEENLWEISGAKMKISAEKLN